MVTNKAIQLKHYRASNEVCSVSPNTVSAEDQALNPLIRIQAQPADIACRIETPCRGIRKNQLSALLPHVSKVTVLHHLLPVDPVDLTLETRNNEFARTEKVTEGLSAGQRCSVGQTETSLHSSENSPPSKTSR